MFFVQKKIFSHRKGAKDAKFYKSEAQGFKFFTKGIAFLRALGFFAVKRFVFSADSQYIGLYGE